MARRRPRSRRFPAGTGRSAARARSVRRLPPRASRRECPRLRVRPVRALPDRAGLPAIPAAAGARVPRFRIASPSSIGWARARLIALTDHHRTATLGGYWESTSAGANRGVATLICHDLIGGSDQGAGYRRALAGRRLTPRSERSHTPGLHHEERAMNGTSTRRASAERPGGWWKPGRRRR
jgi:hypothetical protein